MPDHTSTHLVARVERLERSVRRHFVANVLLVATLCGLTLLASASFVPNEIRARRFVAVDSAGLEVARLDAEAGPGAVLELGGWNGLDDEAHLVRISMAFNEPLLSLSSGNSNAEVGIGFQAPFVRLRSGENVGTFLGVTGESAGLDLTSGSDAPAVSIKAQLDNSGLVMMGPNKVPGVSLIAAEATSGVLVDDARGEPRAMLTFIEPGVASLHLFDADGNEVVTLTAAAESSGLSLGSEEESSVDLAVAADVVGLIMKRMSGSAEDAEVHIKMTEVAGTGILLQDDSGRQLFLKPVK